MKIENTHTYDGKNINDRPQKLFAGKASTKNSQYKQRIQAQNTRTLERTPQIKYRVYYALMHCLYWVFVDALTTRGLRSVVVDDVPRRVCIVMSK